MLHLWRNVLVFFLNKFWYNSEVFWQPFHCWYFIVPCFTWFLIDFKFIEKKHCNILLELQHKSYSTTQTVFLKSTFVFYLSRIYTVLLWQNRWRKMLICKWKLELWVKSQKDTLRPSLLIYLPWNILDRYYSSSCTCSGWILQLCKVKEELRLQDIWTDGRTGWFLYTPPNFVLYW